MKIKKIILVFLGTVSLFVGILAIFIPGLPTTPFLLMMAALYMKSSEKLYRRVISNKLIGPYILEFKENKGMTKRTKVQAIGTMWVMISISCIFFTGSWPLRLVIIGVGLIGTVVMGFIVRTAQKQN